MSGNFLTLFDFPYDTLPVKIEISEIERHTRQTPWERLSSVNSSRSVIVVYPLITA